jgi:hypothetical protein
LTGRRQFGAAKGKVRLVIRSARGVTAVALVVVGLAFVLLALGEGDVLSAAAGILAIITGAILWFSVPRG